MSRSDELLKDAGAASTTPRMTPPEGDCPLHHPRAQGSTTGTVRIDLITTFNRMRQSAPSQVSALAESVREIGLLNPITVVPSGHGFSLVAGLNRLDACRSLGWEDIPAVVLNLDEQRRIIAECDENLCGSVLTPAERAIFTARRKEAYETLHPEAKAHVGPARARWDASANLALAFTDATAQATGRAKRSIQRDAERGEHVCPEALELARHSRLDTGAYLDTLKRLPPGKQVEKVKADLAVPAAPKMNASVPPATQADAADRNPSNGAEALPSPDPAEKALRRELAKLTREALEDEVMGLRAENSDLHKKISDLEIECDDLKAKLRLATADDLGRSVGLLQRRCDQMQFARDEAMKTAKREEFKRKQAEKRASELEAIGVSLN